MRTVSSRTAGQIWTAWERLIVLAFAPALLTHEAAHWIVGRQWALETRFVWKWRDGGRPHVIFKYRPDTNYYKILLAQLAPAIVALMLAPALTWWLLTFGIFTPLSLYLMISWAGIALLSPEDLSVLRWDTSNQGVN